MSFALTSRTAVSLVDMNIAHLHLILTHVTIVGSVAATLILAYALWRFMPSTRDLAVASLVVVALAGIAAYATGGGAEKIIENAGVAEATIEPHEASAVIALIGSLIAGTLAIVV